MFNSFTVLISNISESHVNTTITPTAATTTTAVLRPFVRDYTGELVPKKPINHSHLSWSLTTIIILYLLHPFTTIHSILPVQFMCLTVFLHNLCSSLLWFASWSGTIHFILYTFLHPIIIFFSQHMSIPIQPVLH